MFLWDASPLATSVGSPLYLLGRGLLSRTCPECLFSLLLSLHSCFPFLPPAIIPFLILWKSQLLVIYHFYSLTWPLPQKSKVLCEGWYPHTTWDIRNACWVSYINKTHGSYSKIHFIFNQWAHTVDFVSGCRQGMNWYLLPRVSQLCEEIKEAEATLVCALCVWFQASRTPWALGGKSQGMHAGHMQREWSQMIIPHMDSPGGAGSLLWWGRARSPHLTTVKLPWEVFSLL